MVFEGCDSATVMVKGIANTPAIGAKLELSYGRSGSNSFPAICGATQRGSYREVMMVGLVGPLLALTAVIVVGTAFGSF